MSQQFNEVRISTVARSTFDMKHHHVTTSDFGYIIPVKYRSLVPGDDIVVNPQFFCRLAPLAFPAYGRIKCKVYNFFVPYRVMFDKWDAFLTGYTNTLPPYFTVATLRNFLDLDRQFAPNPGEGSSRGTYGRLMSNFGLNAELVQSQSGLSDNDRISAFPFLAYYRIWMDYFMDSNINEHSTYDIQYKTAYAKGGSLNNYASALLVTRNACFGKDYFTTAKLHPQASEDPSILGVDIASEELNPGLVRPTSGKSSLGISSVGSMSSAAGSVTDANSKVGQFTVEELRVANSFQRYLERNNYVGTKIINQLLAHFGIAPTAERLDMAEYLGGSNLPVQIGDVTATAATDSQSQDPRTVGLGAQAGKAIISGFSEKIRYHATEHGIFMTVFAIIPEAEYYQGISRFWHKGLYGDRFDFYTPEFENCGYQAILNREVFVPKDGVDTYHDYDPEGIFGYNPQYSEYKFEYSVLAGDFIGNLTSSSVMGAQMDAWHLFRKLVYSDEFPLELNNNFVEVQNRNSDYDRVFQITDNQLDHFYFSIDYDCKITRPMVGFAEPSLDVNNSESGRKINLPYGGTRL